MLVTALFLIWPMQQSVTPELQAFRDETVASLLSGETLQPDYRQQLMQMTPEDRIEAIILLRRSGLLTGQAWQTRDLLKPAETERTDPE